MRKYPKRGDNCEHTEDFVCGCMWGSDGLCDRPADRGCILADTEASGKEKVKEDALNRLVKLGAEIGGGIHE